MTLAPPTFAQLLSDAMDARGLSLARIRYHLRRRGHDLSNATLSYWRRGVARPTRGSSLAAVPALEEILGMPAGTLTGALVERLHPDSSGELGLDDLVRSLGLRWDDGLARCAVTDVIDVDERGCQVRHRIRETAVAQRQDVVAYPVATWSDDTATETGIEAVGNCLLGREVRAGSTVVAEIRLPHALRVGEPWMTEIVLTGSTPPSDGMGRWARRVTTPVKILHYTVRFAPQKVPLRAEATFETRGSSTTHPLVVRGSCLELHVQDFGPGTVALSWSW